MIRRFEALWSLHEGEADTSVDDAQSSLPGGASTTDDTDHNAVEPIPGVLVNNASHRSITHAISDESEKERCTPPLDARFDEAVREPCTPPRAETIEARTKDGSENSISLSPSHPSQQEDMWTANVRSRLFGQPTPSPPPNDTAVLNKVEKGALSTARKATTQQRQAKLKHLLLRPRAVNREANIGYYFMQVKKSTIRAAQQEQAKQQTVQLTQKPHQEANYTKTALGKRASSELQQRNDTSKRKRSEPPRSERSVSPMDLADLKHVVDMRAIFERSGETILRLSGLSQEYYNAEKGRRATEEAASEGRERGKAVEAKEYDAARVQTDKERSRDSVRSLKSKRDNLADEARTRPPSSQKRSKGLSRVTSSSSPASSSSKSRHSHKQGPRKKAARKQSNSVEQHLKTIFGCLDYIESDTVYDIAFTELEALAKSFKMPMPAPAMPASLRKLIGEPPLRAKRGSLMM